MKLKRFLFLFIISSLLLSTIISINSDYAIANNQKRRKGIDVDDSETDTQPEESTDEENNGHFVWMPFIGWISFLLSLIIALFVIAWLLMKTRSR